MIAEHDGGVGSKNVRASQLRVNVQPPISGRWRSTKSAHQPPCASSIQAPTLATNSSAISTRAVVPCRNRGWNHHTAGTITAKTTSSSLVSIGAPSKTVTTRPGHTSAVPSATPHASDAIDQNSV